MSNCYTHFHIVLANVPDDQFQWLRAKANELWAARGPDYGGDIDIDIAKTDRGSPDVYVSSIESSDPLFTANLLRAFLAEYRPADRITFEWCEMSDRSSPDAYGGGAALVTATSVEVLSTRDWVKHHQAAGLKVEAAPALAPLTPLALDPLFTPGPKDGHYAESTMLHATHLFTARFTDDVTLKQFLDALRIRKVSPLMSRIEVFGNRGVLFIALLTIDDVLIAEAVCEAMSPRMPYDSGFEDVLICPPNGRTRHSCGRCVMAATRIASGNG